MLKVLVESRAPRQRRTGGMAVSVLVHSTVIGAAVAATAVHAPRPPAPTAPPAPIVWVKPVVVSPVTATGGATGPWTVAPPAPHPFLFHGIPDSVLPPDSLAPSVDPDPGRLIGDPLAVAAPGPSAGDPTAHGGVFWSHQVDREALVVPGGVTPRYPDLLRQAGVEGEVLARFIVDTTGTVRPGSFQAIRSTHELFTIAVRAALPAMRFIPARVGDQKVAQLVEQRFTFTIQ
jgi:periplasmic protein TonB